MTSGSVSLSETQVIDWQSTLSTIQDANAYILATNVFADVTFIVGETEEAIPAHRLILMSRSSVFESVFEAWDREENPKIYVPEVGISAFNAFLKFLYTNDYTDVGGDAAQVLHLAHAYDIRVLSKICSNLLNETIRIQNAIQIYKLAKELQQLDLQEKASSFILKHAQEVFQNSDFYTTDLDLLCSFIQSDELNMSEIEVFRAVMRWAENKCRMRSMEDTSENRRSVCDGAILQIRFPVMDPAEFTSEVVYKQHGVLTEAEVIQVYIYFNSKPESRARLLPLIFNTNPRDSHYKRTTYTTNTPISTGATKLPGFAAPLPVLSSSTSNYRNNPERKSSKKKRTWLSGCV